MGAEPHLTMSKTGLSLLLLACLGLAISHLVSAEKEQQELEATSSDLVQEQPDDAQIRSIREADAKRPKRRKQRKGKKARKANKKRRKNKKSKRKQRKNKKKNGKRKNRKGKKGKRKNGKRKSRKNKRGKNKRKGQRSNTFPKLEQQQSRSTCNVTGLCQKIKNYIKYSNQLRKLKRLNKSCDTMDKKKAKGVAGEFNATADANSGIDDANVTTIAEELKNCSTTIKAN